MFILNARGKYICTPNQLLWFLASARIPVTLKPVKRLPLTDTLGGPPNPGIRCRVGTIRGKSLGTDSTVSTPSIDRVQTFQGMIAVLQEYWMTQGCIVQQPYDMEMGAGTFHSSTFLHAIGPEPWYGCHTQAVSYTHLTLPTTPYV